MGNVLREGDHIRLVVIKKYSKGVSSKCHLLLGKLDTDVS